MKTFPSKSSAHFTQPRDFLQSTYSSLSKNIEFFFCQQQEMNYMIIVLSFCYNILSYFRVFKGVIAAAV